MSKMLIEKFTKANERSQFIINPDTGHVEVRDAFWIWDNFQGKTDEFGNAKKYTNVVVPNKYVEELIKLGYTVKSYPIDKDKDGNVATDPEGNPLLLFFIKININMNSKQIPSVKLITTFKNEKSTRTLDDNSIGDIHGLEVELAAISWNRYSRIQGNKTAVSAYLDKLTVMAEEDSDFGGIFDDYVGKYALDDVEED